MFSWIEVKKIKLQIYGNLRLILQSFPALPRDAYVNNDDDDLLILPCMIWYIKSIKNWYYCTVYIINGNVKAGLGRIPTLHSIFILYANIFLKICKMLIVYYKISLLRLTVDFLVKFTPWKQHLNVVQMTIKILTLLWTAYFEFGYVYIYSS